MFQNGRTVDRHQFDMPDGHSAAIVITCRCTHVPFEFTALSLVSACQDEDNRLLEDASSHSLAYLIMNDQAPPKRSNSASELVRPYRVSPFRAGSAADWSCCVTGQWLQSCFGVKSAAAVPIVKAPYLATGSQFFIQ